MQINVRTHHVDITKALKEYAQKKMEKLSKYMENWQEILVELDVSNASAETQRQVAMGTIWLSGNIIRAKEASVDMYASIDMIYEKLEKQLRKYKERMKNHKKAGKKRSLASSPIISQEDGPRSNRAIVTLAGEDHFIAKPVPPEEARNILEYKALNFVVFRDTVKEKVNVLYLMDNGNYGLIET